MRLTEEFNAGSLVHREKASLMKSWEKLRTDARKYHSDNRQAITGTGGGPSTSKWHPILDLVGTGATGLDDARDSDVGGPSFQDEGATAGDTYETETADIQMDYVVEDYPSINVEDNALPAGIQADTPLWARRRRPVPSEKNERTEGILAVTNSIQAINNKKIDIEQIRETLVLKELEFKQELWRIQLLTAKKELEIKEEHLKKLRGNDDSMSKE